LTTRSSDDSLEANFVGGFWLTYSGSRWIVERLIYE